MTRSRARRETRRRARQVDDRITIASPLTRTAKGSETEIRFWNSSLAKSQCFQAFSLPLIRKSAMIPGLSWDRLEAVPL